jgi:hypothetical protein
MSQSGEQGTEKVVGDLLGKLELDEKNDRKEKDEKLILFDTFANLR